MAEHRKYYSEDIKKAAVEALKNGERLAVVSKRFLVSHQTIGYWLKKFNSTGSVSNITKTGRPRKTSPKQDQLLARMSIRDPRLTAKALTVEINRVTDQPINVSTVKRRLNHAGLFGRRPSRKPLISHKNRMNRLKFAKEHLHWTSANWSKVLWSDESKFNLFSSDGISHVRRPKNQRNHIRYIVPTVKHGGGSVMVWGCFSRDGVGPLFHIEGKMDAIKYGSIVTENMLPFARNSMTRGWIYQQDNDPKHTSSYVKGVFKRHKIKVLEWPSQSPDLNPIEHLWEELDRAVRTRNFTNKHQMKKILEDEWNKLPLTKLTKLVDSMPSRCAAVIASQGYPTKY